MTDNPYHAALGDLPNADYHWTQHSVIHVGFDKQRYEVVKEALTLAAELHGYVRHEYEPPVKGHIHFIHGENND